MLQLLLLFLLLLPTSVVLYVIGILMSVCYSHYSFFFIAARISGGFILLVCQLPLAPVRGLIPCRAQQQQFFNALETLILWAWKKHELACPDLQSVAINVSSQCEFPLTYV